MNNKKTRLQRFISSSIAVLLFAAIALGAALPAAASTAASFTAGFRRNKKDSDNNCECKVRRSGCGTRAGQRSR